MFLPELLLNAMLTDSSLEEGGGSGAARLKVDMELASEEIQNMWKDHWKYMKIFEKIIKISEKISEMELASENSLLSEKSTFLKIKQLKG